MPKFSSAYAFCHFLHEVFPTKQSKLISVEKKLKEKISVFIFPRKTKFPWKRNAWKTSRGNPRKLFIISTHTLPFKQALGPIFPLFLSFSDFFSTDVAQEELLDCCDLMQEVAMDGYESVVFDNVSSSDTPVNVLDHHFLSSESEKTSIVRPESEIKRRKISDFCCNTTNDATFHQLSQQMQRCWEKR